MTSARDAHLHLPLRIGADEQAPLPRHKGHKGEKMPLLHGVLCREEPLILHRLRPELVGSFRLPGV